MPKNLAPWRREWQPTLVFSPGQFYGQRNLGLPQSTGSQRVGHDWATHIFTFRNLATSEKGQFYHWFMTLRVVLTMKNESRSVVSDSAATPWTVALQAPESMGFSRQEHWSGWLFPSPGDLPNPGIKPVSPELAGGFFITESPGKPSVLFGLKISHVWAKTHSIL